MRWKSAAFGWSLLVVYVIAWDWGVAHRMHGETLTAGFARVPRGHWRRALVGVWGVTTLHLFGLLPSKLDPFHWIGRKFETRPDLRRNSLT